MPNLPLLCSSAILVLALAQGTAIFLVINTTKSFPPGIYMKTHGPVQRGDLVLVCPEDNEVNRYGRDHGFISYGVCPGRYGYLIKRIVGSEGDLVEFSGEVVRVNGIPLKNSARQPSIPSRMDGSVKLYEEVLVMSEHPLSFDSRYFGAVSTDAICTPLKPLITWE